MSSRIVKFGLISILVCGAFTTSAAAADRYAAPDGPESPFAACSQATPCGVVSAINDAADGDTIHLASGIYGSPTSPITANLGAGKNNLKIRGASPFDKPLLHLIGNSGQPTFTVNGGEALAEDIRIESYAAVTPAIYGWAIHPTVGKPVLSRVEVAKSESGATALTNANIYNSVLINRSPSGDALSVHSSAAETQPIEEMEVRGSTIWAFGASAEGISMGSSGGVRRVIRLTNSIVHGGGSDLAATANGLNQSRAYIVAEYSSYQEIRQLDNDRFITQQGSGTNTLADPIFVNLAGGDLRQALGSPMIDAGVDSPANGTLDFAGQGRVQGARVDIGAYEATVTTVLSALKAGTTKFLVASRGAALRPASARPKARRGKKRVGTLVSFQLSQADQVTLRLERANSGRRSGSSCVKETRKNRKAKRCTYYAKVSGAESFSGVAGNNVLWFTGRWGGKKLATNTLGFRITAVPTISGLGGPPATSATRAFKPVAR